MRRTTWNQVKARLQFLVDHHGTGLLTGEVGADKSTAARTFTAGLDPNLYKILYLHWSSGSALDLLRQIALELDLEPAHYCGDLVRQISRAIVHLDQSKEQHPILICDEAQRLRHPATLDHMTAISQPTPAMKRRGVITSTCSKRA